MAKKQKPEKLEEPVGVEETEKQKADREKREKDKADKIKVKVDSHRVKCDTDRKRFKEADEKNKRKVIEEISKGKVTYV